MKSLTHSIQVPTQNAPVCTRITTVGVCRRGRFAIGVLHLALGRAQCNGDCPILCTDFHDVRIRYRRGSHAVARRRRAPPSPQGTITTSLPTILCGVEAAGPKNCTSGPVLCRRREVVISQS